MCGGSGRIICGAAWLPPKGGPKVAAAIKICRRPKKESLLAPLHQQAQRGELVTVAKIKLRYQAQVGRSVPDSTVYRVLARHQWRQVQPRPKHPKDNPQARAAFKKTSGQSGRRGGWAPAALAAPDV